MQYGPAAALAIEPMSPGARTVTLSWSARSPPRLSSRQEAPPDLAGYAGVSNRKRQGGRDKEAHLAVKVLPTTPRTVTPIRSPRVNASANSAAADTDIGRETNARDRYRERDECQVALVSASTGTPRAEAALNDEAEKIRTKKKTSSPPAQDCPTVSLLSLETKSAGAPNPTSFAMLK
jgi:hypothetical protein